jgi:hypothetical protein
MRHKFVLCSLLLTFAFADAAAAMTALPHHHRGEVRGVVGGGSPLFTTMEKSPYKNLQDASRWSRLTHGRALTLSLRKQRHHGVQDYCPDCGDTMFPDDGGEWLDPLTGVNLARGSGACGWKCCFKQCMYSAMGSAGELCLNNCTSCVLSPGPISCAICASCGAVGFAATEFCALHCCVDPGC